MLYILVLLFLDLISASGKSAVLAELRTALADSAGAWEKEALRVEVPQSLSSKLKSKLFYKPIETIKTYPAQSFFMDKYEVRLSEEFKMIHFDGLTPQSYQKPTLLSSLKQVTIAVPKDLKDWKYGEKRQILTSNYVKMTEYSRASKLGPWSRGSEVENELLLTVTRYKGRKLENGKRGNDIFVVESIADQFPYVRPVKYKFERGEISGLVIKGDPVVYGGVPTWEVPSVFTHNSKVEIRGTKSFINNHILGNVESDFNAKFLFVFPVVGDKVTLRDSDIAKLKFNQPGLVQTKSKQIRFGYTKDAASGKYDFVNLTPHGHKFEATKYQNSATGKPVLVLTGWHDYLE